MRSSVARYELAMFVRSKRGALDPLTKELTYLLGTAYEESSTLAEH